MPPNQVKITGTKKESHHMEHFIDGVWGAPAVFAPLQDGHAKCRWTVCVSSSARGAKTVCFGESRLNCASNAFLSPFVFAPFEKIGEGACDEGWEAAQPLPLRPPVLTSFQLLFAPSVCCRSVTDILQFPLPLSLSVSHRLWSSATHRESEDLANSTTATVM